MTGWTVYDDIRADLDRLKLELDELAVDIAQWRRCRAITASGEQCRSRWPKGQGSVDTVYYCRRHWPKGVDRS
jgi:hypothetical protein